MTPAYQIRVGKAADRLLFRELLTRLSNTVNLSEYRYIGLGGPFLEDFRLMHDTFPMMRMSSIEQRRQVWMRQKFHKPARHVVLNHCSTQDYFARIYDPEEKAVIWLDYTNLNNGRLREIWGLIKQVCHGTMIRITLRAEGATELDFEKRRAWVSDVFGVYTPEWSRDDVESRGFPTMLLRGLKCVADDATADLHPNMFQLLNAIHYNDGTQMLTFTGIVGDRRFCRSIRAGLRGWEFSNFDWKNPTPISLPALSLKERLLLEPMLPSRTGTGKKLHNKLGYFIEESEPKSIAALDNYRRLSDAYPAVCQSGFLVKSCNCASDYHSHSPVPPRASPVGWPT